MLVDGSHRCGTIRCFWSSSGRAEGGGVPGEWFAKNSETNSFMASASVKRKMAQSDGKVAMTLDGKPEMFVLRGRSTAALVTAEVERGGMQL